MKRQRHLQSFFSKNSAKSRTTIPREVHERRLRLQAAAIRGTKP